MKTRRVYFVMILAILINTVPLFVNAQKFYLKVDAGYGIPVSSFNLDMYYLYDDILDSTTNTQTQINGSLGSGTNFGITAAYRFNDHIACELAASCLLGSKIKAEHQFYEDTWEYSMSASMLRIIPSVVISGKIKKAEPYARLGFIIGAGRVKYITQENNTGNLEEYEWQFDKGLALGISSALGVSYPVGGKLSVFAEISSMNMSYAPQKGTLKKATRDGADILSEMNVNEREIDFEKEIDFRDYDPNSTDVPQKAPAVKLPFGSVGINAGLKISL